MFIYSVTRWCCPRAAVRELISGVMIEVVAMMRRMMAVMRVSWMMAVMRVIVAIVGPLLGAHVLGMADGQLLTLVASQLDRLAHLVGDGSLEASLTQERINRLDTVPTLFYGNLWQVRGCFLVTSLIDKFNTNAMTSNLPVEIVLSFFKASQYGHRDRQTEELFLADWAETAVLHGTCDSIFPDSGMKAHGSKRANTATETPIPADLPCYKQWV
jgi:hypothetical protein